MFHFKKNFKDAVDVSDYLLKLNRALGLDFVVNIFARFFHKNVLYLILYQLAKFQGHTFFQDTNEMCY